MSRGALRRLLPRLVSILLALGLGACGASTPAHFYTLDAAAVADGGSPVRTRVLIAMVTIPATVDQPQFVVQTAPNQVDVDEDNRWAAPLSDEIARAVAGNLSVLLGTPDVATAPMANFVPDYQVSISVQRFDSVKGQAAVLEAVWTVHGAAGFIRSGRTLAREPVTGDSFQALAAAHSLALAKLSEDIAAAIRARVIQTQSAAAR